MPAGAVPKMMASKQMLVMTPDGKKVAASITMATNMATIDSKSEPTVGDLEVDSKVDPVVVELEVGPAVVKNNENLKRRKGTNGNGETARKSDGKTNHTYLVSQITYYLTTIQSRDFHQLLQRNYNHFLTKPESMV